MLPAAIVLESMRRGEEDEQVEEMQERTDEEEKYSVGDNGRSSGDGCPGGVDDGALD